MKKLFATLIVIVIAATASAQKRSTANTGTWVIESNVKTPKSQIIKYYDENLKLIHEEKVEGKKLNISKWKVQAKLNNKLNELVKSNIALVASKR